MTANALPFLCENSLGEINRDFCGVELDQTVLKRKSLSNY